MADRPRRYVIVGNGIAGTTAAETLRKNDPTCTIDLLTDEPYPLYNRLALPPFLKGKVSEQKVYIRSREFHERLGITLRLETPVIGVDLAERVVLTARGEALPFDALLIATGGRPNRLPVPGGDCEGVYNFQTLDDAKAINERLRLARQAVTVGGSYIAYELTEAFRARGLAVTWIMRGPWFLRRLLDAEGGALVDAIAREHGVEVVHGEEIARIEGRDGMVTRVYTTGGREYPADIVGVGIGITRNVAFLRETPLTIRTGVVTDEYLFTGVPGVYAAGDVAEFFDRTIGQHNIMGTWDNATVHGKVVAVNMAGGCQPYEEVPTYSTTLFDSRILSIGVTPENRPDLEAVSWIDWTTRTYRRLFFLEDRLVGAVFIGDRRGRTKVLELIRQRERIADKQALVAAL
jgi:NAD(P)H-nitrite reductase large subunit